MASARDPLRPPLTTTGSAVKTLRLSTYSPTNASAAAALKLSPSKAPSAPQPLISPFRNPTASSPSNLRVFGGASANPSALHTQHKASPAPFTTNKLTPSKRPLSASAPSNYSAAPHSPSMQYNNMLHPPVYPSSAATAAAARRGAPRSGEKHLHVLAAAVASAAVACIAVLFSDVRASMNLFEVVVLYSHHMLDAHGIHASAFSTTTKPRPAVIVPADEELDTHGTLEAHVLSGALPVSQKRRVCLLSRRFYDVHQALARVSSVLSLEHKCSGPVKPSFLITKCAFSL